MAENPVERVRWREERHLLKPVAKRRLPARWIGNGDASIRGSSRIFPVKAQACSYLASEKLRMPSQGRMQDMECRHSLSALDRCLTELGCLGEQSRQAAH